MARDSRADIFEDDLFSKTQPKIHRVHAHHSSDGTIHIDVGNRNTSGLGSIFGVNHRKPVELHKVVSGIFPKKKKSIYY